MSKPPLRALLLTLALLSTASCRARSPREQLERQFVREGIVLKQPSLVIASNAVARGMVFTLAMLEKTPLYARPRAAPEDYLFIDSRGAVSRAGNSLGSVRAAGELLLVPGATALFLDGVPFDLDLHDWDVFWVCTGTARPALHWVSYPPVALADSFMRIQLAEDSCRLSSGTWHLCRHGGGMPTTEAEAESAEFARAVNPFTVQGSGSGYLTFGDTNWIHYGAEARFYFGVPRQGEVTDAQSLPIQTDLMVVQGELHGNQVAFGWCGSLASFALMTRTGGGEWTVVERLRGRRPPLTNWVRIGLEVAAGHRARGLLDGVAVAESNLGSRVAGPFHLHCGAGLMEADDARAWTLGASRRLLTPLQSRSRFFAVKRLKGERDPAEFVDWARSAGMFTKSLRVAPDGTRQAAITTTFPLMGEFEYESVPFSDTAGRLPHGTYEFSLHPSSLDRAADPQTAPPTAKFRAALTATGWSVSDLAGLPWPSRHEEFALRFARRAEDGMRLSLWVSNQWRACSAPLPEPCHISIARVAAAGVSDTPSPEHHALACANLVNEFFEEAPTAWNWIDGSFRMACRWGCENLWNFMACGSPGVPLMASKRCYAGDQAHEYYLSLRSVFPWDAGDAGFAYDADADRASGFRIFSAHHAWYNRRDLNFSFCCDGRNPLSGYSVAFGADDNAETRLLRKGRVVARTREPRFLFPTDPSHAAVHWRWWKFTVRKQSGRILVQLNDELLFDYADPVPLDGGHVAFWTVRNGFSVARVISMAERVTESPHVLYVDEGAHTAWVPLLRDSVTLAREPDHRTRVTSNVGAGFFAVRHEWREPVDLRERPVLELPFEAGPTTAVNLHLEIGAASYLIKLGAPLAGLRSLLTSEYERGECFQIPVLAEEDIRRTRLLAEALPDADGVIRLDLGECLSRLTGGLATPFLKSLTVGNTSNADYLLAASDGTNTAGSWYKLGAPRLSRKP